MSDPTNPDSTLGDRGEHPFPDRIEDADYADETATNDAVAGETVLPGAGDGNDGPTGGSPKEGGADWEHYSPDTPAPDEAQPFGDKTPDDLRTDDGRTHEVHVSADEPENTDWTEDTV